MTFHNVSIRHRPATGPGSLCAECKKPFTVEQWDKRHTTGAPDKQRFTHGACCWCAR